MKLKLPRLLLCLSFFTFSTSFAQERCKSGVIHRQLMQSDPDYALKIQQNEALIQQHLSNPMRTSGVYTIPVVVHVLHLGEAVGTGTNISDAQINSAIANMNECYSGSGSYPLDIEVQFQLASRGPNCTSTTGINRINASGTSTYATSGITTANETTIKALSKWPSSEYYNIWIVSEIDGNNGGSGTQGYAYFAGAGSSVDGAVILYNAFGYDPTGTIGYTLKSYTRHNATANHELGHAFDLYHTFEGDDANLDGTEDQCPSNTDCTSDGDLCCDTEAHRRDDGDCGATGSTCTGQSISTIVENIMAYSSDNCQVRFTDDQKARMRAAILASRGTLLTSPAFLPVTGSEPVVSKTCSPNSTNLSNGFEMGVYGLTIGSTAYSSSGTVAEGGFRNNWCNNFSLAPNTLYSIQVDNATVNPEKVKVYIDYNNDGDFSDSGENIFNGTSAGASHAGSFTTPASPVTGQSLWLRVVSEFGGLTITGPCYAPTYGQVEDFSVTFTGCTAPTITGTTPASRCGTGTLTLGATASAGTLNWYAASSGGSSLGTGASFTTPSISTTTSYFVDATSSGCTSARTAVIATINAIPSVSGTTPGSRCGTGSVTLGASASAGTLNWYAASTGGSSLGTGPSFTTPSISSTTTYFVDATNSGCTSSRTSVAATVNTTPAVTGTTPGTRCGTGTVVLGATASAGSLKWYAASSGGSSIGTGTTFTTPSISSTTTYFVEAENSGCTSLRSSVIATVSPGPTITISSSGPLCNGSSDGTLTTSVSGGTPSYAYSWNTGATTSGLSALPAGSYTVTVTDAGGCSNIQSAVLSNPAALSLSATSTQSSCSDNDGAIDLSVSGGTAGYTYLWNGGATTQDVTGLSQGTYTVTVNDANGCSSQNISTVSQNCLTVPNTQIASSQCGATLADFTGSFYCNAVSGAQDYQFEFVNTGLGFSIAKMRGGPWANIARSSITGLQYGVTYSVRVRAKVAGVWGVYSTSCNITIGSSIPSTQVASSQCGQVVPDLTGSFYCNAVSGAEDYEWEFVNSATAYSMTKQRGGAWANIGRATIAGLQYGMTYNVRVRAKVGGTWGAFGTSCTITIGSGIPSTQVASSQCGQVIPDFSGSFYCNAVSGAEDYEWEFVNSGSAYSMTKQRGGAWANIGRTAITGLQYGLSYNVRVRAKVGGVWGAYGSTCVITMGSFPATSLIASQCGQTMNLSGLFYCDAVSGAQDYQWEITNSSLGYSATAIRGGAWANISKSMFSGLLSGNTYDVRIRTKVGGVWSSYGTACSITINTSMLGLYENGALREFDEAGSSEVIQPETTEYVLNAFPNPSGNEGFRISLDGLAKDGAVMELFVYDMYGKLMHAETFSGSAGLQAFTLNADGALKNGMYLLAVRIEGKVLTQKIIVR